MPCTAEEAAMMKLCVWFKDAKVSMSGFTVTLGVSRLWTVAMYVAFVAPTLVTVLEKLTEYGMKTSTQNAMEG